MKRRKGLSIKKCLIAFFLLVLLCIVGLAVFIFISLRPVTNDDEYVSYSVAEGNGISTIIDNLESDGLIRNALVAKVYFRLFLSDKVVQAGNYQLSSSMSLKEIFEALDNPNPHRAEITVTFPEGKSMVEFARVIRDNFGYKEKDIYKVINDKDFIKKLISEYWFLTDDILNNDIYYPLEGYLFANTYNFYEDASIKDIVYKLLDQTDLVLTPYKEQLENNKYSIHELITIASITQKEGTNSKSLAKVASVVYNRLNLPQRLEMCSTAYYGAKRIQGEDDFGDSDSLVNAYNTYEIDGLPVGPISSVTSASIEAAINPAKTNYYYFASDSSLNLYFSKTYDQHENTIQSLKDQGVWSGS